MCNACGFGCCAFDSFDGCGCDCAVAECRLTRRDGCGQLVDATLVGDECACDYADSLDDEFDDHGARFAMPRDGARDSADLTHSGRTEIRDPAKVAHATRMC